MSGKVSGGWIPLRSNNPIKGSSWLELHSGGVGGLCSLYFFLRNDWLHSSASSPETVNVNMQREVKPTAWRTWTGSCVCCQSGFACVLACTELQKGISCVRRSEGESLSGQSLTKYGLILLSNRAASQQCVILDFGFLSNKVPESLSHLRIKLNSLFRLSGTHHFHHLLWRFFVISVQL